MEAVNISVGGVVILVDERPGGLFVNLEDSIMFRDDLFAVPGVREVDGPLVNGIYAITCDIDKDQPVEAHVDRLQKQIFRVWARHAS